MRPRPQPRGDRVANSRHQGAQGRLRNHLTVHNDHCRVGRIDAQLLKDALFICDDGHGAARRTSGSRRRHDDERQTVQRRHRPRRIGGTPSPNAHHSIARAEVRHRCKAVNLRRRAGARKVLVDEDCAGAVKRLFDTTVHAGHGQFFRHHQEVVAQP
jgi:hypothetical protein